MSIKNTVTLAEKKTKIDTSTHQTNGTYEYRINTKLKTHKLKLSKKNTFFFFFKG